MIKTEADYEAALAELERLELCIHYARMTVTILLAGVVAVSVAVR